jgi:DNA-binding LacI/PurR family transcriptional regulator
LIQASLRDVAARAGVSFQTVSKTLNGKGAVSPATRERILMAAEQLGYVPNAMARSLVTQRTQTIGVVASDLTDSVLAQFVVGAEREARRQGHAVIIASIDQEGSDGEHYLRTLIERRVDGILMAAPELEHNPRVGDILRARMPAVGIHHIVGGRITIVGSDHSQTGRLATAHLLTLGHRRIGTITGTHARLVTHSRLRGYQKALQQAGVAYDPTLVEAGDWTVEGGYQATHRLLNRAPDITALFVQNDTMAIGVLQALNERQQRVPGDCAVVGCDDIPIAAHTIPPLTTVHIPFYETGETAMRLLLASIAHPTTEPQRLLLPVHLVIRSSCGANSAAR